MGASMEPTDQAPLAPTMTLRPWDPAAWIAGALIFVLVMFLPAILNDGDTLWQIRTGEWILAHNAIPRIDPFSFTAGDRPWFAHEWLSESLMAIAYGIGGMRGVMGLAAAAAGATAGIVIWTARLFLPGLYAVVALAFALSNAAPSMLARPHLLAWPFLALWCAGLVTARARRTSPSLWLLPVMLVWVNLHGSFMAGLLLPPALMIEALLDPGANRGRVIKQWGLFILGSAVAALCNPDFLAGAVFPIRMLGMRSLSWIGEWEPTNFSQLQPLELIILAAIGLGATGRVKIPPVRLILFLGLIHAALSHVRNEQLLGLMGTILLAEPLGKALGRGAAAPLKGMWPRLAQVAIACAVLAAGARAKVPFEPARARMEIAALLERLPPDLRAKPVLNEYGLGCEMIFEGVRPFIDSRADLYGDAFLTRYRQATGTDRAALDRLLGDYRIAWTIFPAYHPAIALMDAEPGWRRLIEAGGFVVHVRETGPS